MSRKIARVRCGGAEVGVEAAWRRRRRRRRRCHNWREMRRLLSLMQTPGSDDRSNSTYWRKGVWVEGKS
jgi:hypothetical protein